MLKSEGKEVEIYVPRSEFSLPLIFLAPRGDVTPPLERSDIPFLPLVF
jgi:hypothetical protein